MVQTVDFSTFHDAFTKMNREENFTYGGLRALFDWFEEYEDACGEPQELDVIAICCDFTQYTYEEALTELEHAIDVEELEGLTGEDYREVILDQLGDHTIVIPVDDETMIVQAF